MIKAVFFDFDGVLTKDKSGSVTTCKNLHKTTGIPFETLKKACHTTKEYYIGRMSIAEFWKNVCKKLGKEIDMELLRQAYGEIPIDNEMMELVRRLREKYSVGIITDNPKERFDTVLINQQLDAKFDSIIVSSFVGSAKKEEAIFERALESLTLEPSQCVFIDNSKGNLEIPEKIGFRTIHFDDRKRDFNELIDNLRKAGVKLD